MDENALPHGGSGAVDSRPYRNQLGDNNNMTDGGFLHNRWNVMSQHIADGSTLLSGKENAAGQTKSSNPPSAKKKTPFKLWGKNVINSDDNVKDKGVDGKETDVYKTQKRKTPKKKQQTKKNNQTTQKTVPVPIEPSKKVGIGIFNVFGKSQPKNEKQQKEEELDVSFDKYELKWTKSFDEFASDWEDGDANEVDELLQSAFQDGSYRDPSEESYGDSEETLGDMIQEVIQLNALDPTLLVRNGEFTETAQQLIGDIQALTKELNTTAEGKEQDLTKLMDVYENGRPTLTGAAAKNAEGHKLLLQGNYEHAMELFDEALRDLSEVSCTGALDPRMPLLREHLGDLALNTACELEMASVVANMAEHHLHVDEYEMASNTAQRAIELDPHNTKAWLQMARAEFHLKNYCRAALAAERGPSAEGGALYQEIKQQLQPILDQHQGLFRRIIDSYRIRVEDEFKLDIVGRNSLPDLHVQNSQSEDAGSFRESPLCGGEFKSLPLKHFRGYVRAILVRNVFTKEIQERISPSGGDLFQALCFMAMADNFSNIGVQATLADIEAYYYLESGMDDTVESLRDLAQSILGPIGDLESTATKISLVEYCMSDNEDDIDQELLGGED